jgi:hypothetical protein
MPRSLIDCVVYSEQPHIILDFAMGAIPLMILDEDTLKGNDMADYQGRMFLHSTKYPDENAKRMGLDGLKYSIAFEGKRNPDDVSDAEVESLVPECAMIGWVNVKIEPYQESMYMADMDRHNLFYDWEQLKEMRGWTPMTKVFGLTMSNFHLIKSPIIGIRKDNTAQLGEFWRPGEPIELEAMKMCLEKDRMRLIPNDYATQMMEWFDTLDE